MSDIDNLGASVDVNILNEVICKGHGALSFVVDEFKSVKKFRIFNTNNLWMHLHEIKRLVESKSMELDIIVNLT